MQLRTFLFFFFIAFAFAAVAQDYTGVWEGHFYLHGKKSRINVRIEVTQKDEKFIGFVSTRGFEKNTAYGCDYVVYGLADRNKLRLKITNVRRGVAVKITDCSSLDWVELSLKENDTSNISKSRWCWIDSSINTFTATKTATEVSELAKEEMKSVKYSSELSRDYVSDEKRMYSRFSGNLGVKWVENKELSIVVTPVDKNTKARITVTVNDNIVADYFDLSKSVLVIKLTDIPEICKIEFINNSDKKYKLEMNVLISQEEMKEELNVTVFPGGFASLSLNRKK